MSILCLPSTEGRKVFPIQVPTRDQQKKVEKMVHTTLEADDLSTGGGGRRGIIPAHLGVLKEGRKTVGLF